MKKRYKNWITVTAHVAIMILSLLTPFMSLGSAKAAEVKPGLYNFSMKAEFIDGSKIKVDVDGTYLTGTNQIPVSVHREFVDANPFDDELRFRDLDKTCGDSWILLDSRTGTSGKLKIEAKGSYSGAKCEKVVDQGFAGIGSGTKNQLYFNWENQDSIASISQGLKLGITVAGSRQFKATSDKNLLSIEAPGPFKCDLTLDITNPNNENGNLQIKCTYTDTTRTQQEKTKTYTNVSIGNPAAASTAPNTGTGGVDATGDSRPSCETTSGNPLSWGLCPAINGAAAIADWVLESFIVPFLENVPISTDRGGDSTGVFDAWSGFRILANIMLVGVLLFIVIAEAVGKE